MGDRGASSEVEEITVTLAGLEITISVRPQRVASTSTSPPVASLHSIVPRAPTGFILGFDPVTPDLIERTLAASGTRQFELLHLTFLDYLTHRLHSQHRVWTAAARIGRAFKAGVGARLRLGGQLVPGVTEATPFRSTYYLCLVAPRYPEGFWTPDYSSYIDRVFGPGGDFHPDSISHGFATRSESEAYLVGAGKQWPQRL